MEDTWALRDLPVLDAIVTALEGQMEVNGGQVADMTGLHADDVVSAFFDLQGEYIGPVTVRVSGEVCVRQVSGDARRAVGQWPTAESLIGRLIAGLEQAADREAEPERKSRFRSLAAGLGGFANAVAVNVASQIVGQHIPH